jgi:hypothetical protein
MLEDALTQLMTLRTRFYCVGVPNPTANLNRELGPRLSNKYRPFWRQGKLSATISKRDLGHLVFSHMRCSFISSHLKLPTGAR